MEEGEGERRKEGRGLLMVRRLNGVDLPLGLCQVQLLQTVLFFCFFLLASHLLDSKSMAAAAVCPQHFGLLCRQQRGFKCTELKGEKNIKGGCFSESMSK